MAENCLICDGRFKQEYVVYSNDGWLIRHSEETNILGYFIIQPTRHILDLSLSEEAEYTKYGELLKDLMTSIRQLTDCERIYTFSLAEAVPHYHLHVIPRSSTFPRTYRGRGITSYPTSPACSEELVVEVCLRTRKALNRLSSQLPR